MIALDVCHLRCSFAHPFCRAVAAGDRFPLQRLIRFMAAAWPGRQARVCACRGPAAAVCERMMPAQPFSHHMCYRLNAMTACLLSSHVISLKSMPQLTIVSPCQFSKFSQSNSGHRTSHRMRYRGQQVAQSTPTTVPRHTRNQSYTGRRSCLQRCTCRLQQLRETRAQPDNRGATSCRGASERRGQATTGRLCHARQPRASNVPS